MKGLTAGFVMLLLAGCANTSNVEPETPASEQQTDVHDCASAATPESSDKVSVVRPAGWTSVVELGMNDGSVFSMNRDGTDVRLRTFIVASTTGGPMFLMDEIQTRVQHSADSWDATYSIWHLDPEVVLSLQFKSPNGSSGAAVVREIAPYVYALVIAWSPSGNISNSTLDEVADFASTVTFPGPTPKSPPENDKK